MAAIPDTCASLLVVILLGLPTAEAAERAPLALMSVAMIDEAEIPTFIRDGAVAEATRIYRAAGVTLVWLTHEHVSESAFIVKIVRKPIGNAGTVTRALAIAPMSGRRRGRHVWVFYQRIVERANLLQMSCPPLLGAVIAHELGHLLLPQSAHSKQGLMRRTWDSRDVQRTMWGVLNFNAGEAALIRSRLAGSTDRLAD